LPCSAVGAGWRGGGWNKKQSKDINNDKFSESANSNPQRYRVAKQKMSLRAPTVD
jgi:hypothetical protein